MGTRPADGGVQSPKAVSTILTKPKVQSKHSTFRFTYRFHTVEQIQDLRGMPWNRIFEADTCQIVPETIPNLVLSKMSVMPLSQFVFGWSEIHTKTRNISRGPRTSWTGASRRCHGQGEKCSRDIPKKLGVYSSTDAHSHYNELHCAAAPLASEGDRAGSRS
jgi:hypothetical protein